ncbi:hypothetical protein P9112_009864 [Eukaryota sp. TZLM1-RC]
MSLTYIANLTPSESCTIGGMVTNYRGIKQTKNGNSVCNFNLSDGTGSIRVTLWGEDAESQSLSQRQIIMIQNVRIKPRQSTGFPDNNTSEYEATFTESSVIIPAQPNRFPINAPPRCKINAMSQFIDQMVHVCCVVVAKFPTEQIQTKRGTDTLKMTIRVADESNACNLTLWGEHNIAMGEQLPMHSVIELVAAKVVAYKDNVSISVTGETELVTHARSADARSLETMVQNGTIDVKNLAKIKQPSLEDDDIALETVVQFLNHQNDQQQELKVFAKIIGFVTEIGLTGSKGYYMACHECNGRIRDGQCRRCGNINPGRPHYLVHISIADHTGSVNGVVFGENAEAILGLASGQFAQLSDEQRNELEQFFIWKPYLILLKSKRGLSGNLSVECISIKNVTQKEVNMFGIIDGGDVVSVGTKMNFSYGSVGDQNVQPIIEPKISPPQILNSSQTSMPSTPRQLPPSYSLVQKPTKTPRKGTEILKKLQKSPKVGIGSPKVNVKPPKLRQTTLNCVKTERNGSKFNKLSSAPLPVTKRIAPPF